MTHDAPEQVHVSPDQEIAPPTHEMGEAARVVTERFDAVAANLQHPHFGIQLKTQELPDESGTQHILEHFYQGGPMDALNRHIETYTISPDGIPSATFLVENGKSGEVSQSAQAPESPEDQEKLLGRILGLVDKVEAIDKKTTEAATTGAVERPRVQQRGAGARLLKFLGLGSR